MNYNSKFWILIFIIFILSAFAASGQQLTPEQLGWKSHTINSKEFGTINYYITSQDINKQKPVLLYLDGSGALPLYQSMQGGTGSTVPFDTKKLSEKFHLVIISKPGVPFIDSVTMEPGIPYPQYPTPLEYKRRLSLEWRVAAADLTLKEIIKNYKVDKSSINILGISEGFQVGSKLLTVNKSVTKAVLLVGNGLNQFYDFIISNRTYAQLGKITQEESQHNIDTLLKTFRDIYNHENSTEKEWMGHTYLRWASFCKNNPTDNLNCTNIPVYVVIAANDTNTSAISADYIALEQSRLKKNNIIYKVLPYDHSLSEMIKDEHGNITGAKNHMLEVIDEALIWINQ